MVYLDECRGDLWFLVLWCFLSCWLFNRLSKKVAVSKCDRVMAFGSVNMAPALHTNLTSQSLFLLLMSSTCLT
jgi:hypothetical protein